MLRQVCPAKEWSENVCKNDCNKSSQTKKVTSSVNKEQNHEPSSAALPLGKADVKTSSHNTVKKVMVGFYNMGGPSSLEEVEPFLSRLFNDPDLLDLPFGRLLQNFVAQKIIKKRLTEVQERYTHLGGKSAQLGITQDLARAVQASVGNQLGNFVIEGIVPMMRYSNPSAQDLLNAALAKKCDEIWLYSQYPHCARATTGTSLREMGMLRAAQPAAAGLRLRNFASYWDNPDFISLWADRLGKAWSALKSPRKFLVISAHNLPLSYVAEGDPYPHHIFRTAREVMRKLGLREGAHWSLAWQSSVGPVKWMTPDTRDEIARLGAAKVESVLVWPISFVSDHIETQFEIDIEFGELAAAAGIKEFTRVRNLNSDPDFVQYVSKTMQTAAQELTRQGYSPLLRDLDTQPSGEACHRQAGGCLCGRYYTSGRAGLARGTVPRKMPKTHPTPQEWEKVFEANAAGSK